MPRSVAARSWLSVRAGGTTPSPHTPFHSGNHGVPIDTPIRFSVEPQRVTDVVKCVVGTSRHAIVSSLRVLHRAICISDPYTPIRYIVLPFIFGRDWSIGSPQ